MSDFLMMTLLIVATIVGAFVMTILFYAIRYYIDMYGRELKTKIKHWYAKYFQAKKG